MSGSFEISGGQIVITNGARTVATTGGTLINLLPAANDFGSLASPETVSVVFPDFTKDYVYNWWWSVDYSSLANEYAKDNGAKSYITAIPQEWSAITNLVAVPAGADVFAGMVRISRSVNPNNTWVGSAIDVLPKQSQWLPFTGSVLCEAELGMARAFSIYISGGYLVLHRQQSVCVEPGGFGVYGSVSSGAPYAPSGADSNGGENVYGTTKGLPVYLRATKDSATTVEPSGDPPTPPGIKDTHRISGSDPCSTSDTTNYQSTYSVEIAGAFGRRS